MSASAPFHAIGIDIGGTKIAAAIVSFPDGRVSERRRIATRSGRGPEAVLSDVENLARTLAADAKIDAIGLGICELVSPQGRVLSGNCIDWRNVPVIERLSAIAPSVAIEADVRAAALAEATFGAGRDLDCFLYVTVGTGISCCLVIDGKPFTGARGATGTMASSSLGHACPKCGHNDHRSLEDIASGPGIGAAYGLAAGRTVRGAEEVLSAADAGDPVALRILAHAGDALGTAVGSLVNVTDPEAVILGGGLGLAGGVYRQRILDGARAHIWWDGHRDIPIVPAETGEDAGVIGAAVAAWRRSRAS